MKTIQLYCFLCAVVLAVLLSCNSRSSLPSLEETYSKSDKIPFGTYVAFKQLNELFYRNDISVKRTPVDKSLEDFNDTASLYICISKNFFLKRTESRALLDYVNRGNNAFISARRFDSSFLKEMEVDIENAGFHYFPSIMDMKYTGVGLFEPYFADTTSYNYYYNPLNSFFHVKKEIENVRMLGKNDKAQPNFIVIFHGKGRIFLHSEPRVFSNYFLLQDKNYQYLQHVFSLLPEVPDNVLWDDYYNKRDNLPRETDSNKDDGGKSGFSVLLKYPAMAWAFWLTVLLLVIYLIFGGKRRQRIIKPIAQTENTSVAFTETVGRLYLQKKDNWNIADKMITYLLEHIRNQYFISTNNLNEEFIAMLSRKSNVSFEQVQKLVGTINVVRQMDTIEDDVLLSLNQQIENYYKNKS